jgi:hypothetical protein
MRKATGKALAGVQAALVAACATSPSPSSLSSPSPPPPPSPFVRSIDPFPVLDPSGAAYAFPFLGGFDVPRPQFHDIDGDGDLDLFVQERSAALIHFENIGSARAARFSWRSDRFQDLDVGEWSRFIDIDQDGDLDLLAEERFSNIRYFRNDGTARRPEFVLAADTLRDVEGRAVFADRQNIPFIVDLDCNGRLDLFLGRVDGTITRFELAHLDPTGVPRFRFVTDRFEGIEIVAQLGTRHGANSMALADADADGDLDFFWGDFFEPGVLYIENRGSCAAPALRDEPGHAVTADSLRTSGYNAPVFADLDGDGDLDFAVGVLGGAFNPNRTASSNFLFLERVDGVWHERTRRFLNGIDAGSESAPALADLDADGDLDLLVSSKIDPVRLNTSRILRFENRGTRAAPRFALADTLGLRTVYHQAPALGDLDGDGDLDLLLGTWNQGISYLRNEGSARSARFVLVDSAWVTLTRGSNAMPALGDLDADGDLDLMVGEASGQLNLYRNTGTRTEPGFELVSDEFDGIDVGRRSAPALADIDGDGDLDLLVGSEEGGIRLFRNNGTRAAARFEADDNFVVPLLPFSAPAFGDVDGDGDLDVMAGGLSGGLVYFRNTGRG